MPPQGNGLVEVGTRARLAKRRVALGSQQAYIAAEGFDCATMDAPRQNREETPGVVAFFWGFPFMDAEQRGFIPVGSERLHGPIADQEAKAHGSKLVKAGMPVCGAAAISERHALIAAR